MSAFWAWMGRTAGNKHDKQNKEYDANDDVGSDDTIDVVGVDRESSRSSDGALTNASGDVLALGGFAVASSAFGV